MKVLHIGKYYPPFLGGIETVNYDIVEGLCEAGIKTDTIVLNHSRKEKVEESKSENIFRESTLFNISSQPVSFSYLRRIIKLVNKYDIVHIHLPNPLATLPFMFLRKRKYKLILHWHSDIVKQKLLKFFYGPIQKNILKKADKVITTSGNYGLYSPDLKDFQDKITTIPIGIEKKKYSGVTCHVLEKIIESNPGKKIIFSLGRLVYYKGFSFLIEAARKTVEDAIFIIGGSGPLKKDLEDQVRKNNLQGKVHLVGRIDDEKLPLYFEKCHLFCFPSIEKSEAFGVSQIEAMAYGKPVVSTNIKGSGVSWVNKHMVSGLIVSPKCSNELAESINLVLKNSELYDRLSSGSEKRFKSVFTKEQMLESCIDLYKAE